MLKEDVELNKPGAQQVLNEYKDHLREFVRLYLQGYKDFEGWREQEAPRVQDMNCEKITLPPWVIAGLILCSWIQHRHPRPFYYNLFTRDTELRYEDECLP